MQSMNGTRATWMAAALALAFTWVLHGSTARASQPEGVDIDKLTRRAGVVLEGRVTNVQGAWDASFGRIHTTVTVQVRRYYKGDLPQDTVDITYLGGTVDDITFAVLGQPSFETDEDVLLFLRSDHSRGDFPFVNGEEGKFTESTDPRSREQVLRSRYKSMSKRAAVESIGRVVSSMRALGH